MAHIFVGLMMGIAFGFLLEKARVFEPAVLVRQFQLRNFLMVKVFFTAMATSIVAIALLKATVGGFTFLLEPVHLMGNALGGTLLGCGVALTGACPGTVLAQVGAGYRDARFTLFGGLLGATTYMLIKAPLIDSLFFNGPATPVTFSNLLGIPFEVMAAAMVIAIATALLFLERRSSWRYDVGPNFDGITA